MANHQFRHRAHQEQIEPMQIRFDAAMKSSMNSDHGTYNGQSGDSTPPDQESDTHPASEHQHNLTDRDTIDETNKTADYDPDAWKEDEDPPLELDYDALKHIATYFVPRDHGKCVSIFKQSRGAFHEIRLLRFADGFECIGRFTRDRQEASSVLESEVATVRYVREHTSIPVPEVYFVNTNPHHVVGSPFVLMEKLRGRHLYSIWEKLSLRQKFEVIEQVADTLHKLVELKFDKIGSLRFGGEVGPLQNLAYSYQEPGRGPFTDLSEWASSFLDPCEKRPEAVMAQYPKVRKVIHDFLQQQNDNPILRKPFRLIHGDFDAQNMLFTWEGEEARPQLSGLIDWDNSYAGPLYYLCEYPIFIQDLDMPGTRELYAENSILRKYFVYRLSRHYPADSQDRLDVLESFRQKSYTLNGFRNIFSGSLWSIPEMELRVVTDYLEAHVPGTTKSMESYPYGGKLAWEPDSEYEGDSGEETDEDNSGTDEEGSDSED